MTSAWLGIRLALTPAARVRTALVVLAALLVTVVLLTTLAAGRYELRYSLAYQTEMPRLVLAAVAAVTLPCVVLLATVSRLSAALRDRRLANLRLIGLTPTQTRVVGAAETGVAATAGALLGAITFLLVRPVLVAHPLAGRTWDQTFGPTPVDWVAVLVGVPTVVVLAGLVPTRTTTRDPLAVARRADRTPPGWWRLGPLTLGAVLCAVVLQGYQTSSEATDRQVALFFAGASLLGLGLVLVLPALVRLLTRALTGRPLGAASRIAVRRLEAQPAGVARIIGALLVGLFLVTGARYVLVAFESTPQYQQAERGLEDEQRVSLMAQQRQVDTVTAQAAAADGVREVVDLPTLTAGRFGTTAIVATCAELARVAPRIHGCRDGEAMWIDGNVGNVLGKRPEIAWRAGDVHRRTVLTTSTNLPNMGNANSWEALDPLWADAIIPPDQVAALPSDTSHLILVTGPPGRDLVDRLNAIDLSIYSSADYSEYDFVATMRGIIWTIAAVVLGVGLLALTIATVDRAVQRRKEVVALQLVGVAPRVVRRAQLIESAAPLTIGIVLAVGLGALGGATFLTLNETVAMPWTQTWRLAATGVLGGLVVAGICMLAATPRLRPEEIRAE